MSLSKRSRFKRGDVVEILSSRHPDVHAGSIGIVDCYHSNGYGVNIKASWEIAGSDRGAKVTESRVVWYPASELVTAV